MKAHGPPTGKTLHSWQQRYSAEKQDLHAPTAPMSAEVTPMDLSRTNHNHQHQQREPAALVAEKRIFSPVTVPVGTTTRPWQGLAPSVYASASPSPSPSPSATSSTTTAEPSPKRVLSSSFSSAPKSRRTPLSSGGGGGHHAKLGIAHCPPKSSSKEGGKEEEEEDVRARTMRLRSSRHAFSSVSPADTTATATVAAEDAGTFGSKAIVDIGTAVGTPSVGWPGAEKKASPFVLPPRQVIGDGDGGASVSTAHADPAVRRAFSFCTVSMGVGMGPRVATASSKTSVRRTYQRSASFSGDLAASGTKDFSLHRNGRQVEPHDKSRRGLQRVKFVRALRRTFSFSTSGTHAADKPGETAVGSTEEIISAIATEIEAVNPASAATVRSSAKTPSSSWVLPPRRGAHDDGGGALAIARADGVTKERLAIGSAASSAAAPAALKASLQKVCQQSNSCDGDTAAPTAARAEDSASLPPQAAPHDRPRWGVRRGTRKVRGFRRSFSSATNSTAAASDTETDYSVTATTTTSSGGVEVVDAASAEGLWTDAKASSSASWVVPPRKIASDGGSVLPTAHAVHAGYAPQLLSIDSAPSLVAGAAGAAPLKELPPLMLNSGVAVQSGVSVPTAKAIVASVNHNRLVESCDSSEGSCSGKRGSGADGPTFGSHPIAAATATATGTEISVVTTPNTPSPRTFTRCQPRAVDALATACTDFASHRDSIGSASPATGAGGMWAAPVASNIPPWPRTLPRSTNSDCDAAGGTTTMATATAIGLGNMDNRRLLQRSLSRGASPCPVRVAVAEGACRRSLALSTSEAATAAASVAESDITLSTAATAGIEPLDTTLVVGRPDGTTPSSGIVLPLQVVGDGGGGGGALVVANSGLDVPRLPVVSANHNGTLALQRSLSRGAFPGNEAVLGGARRGSSSLSTNDAETAITLGAAGIEAVDTTSDDRINEGRGITGAAALCATSVRAAAAAAAAEQARLRRRSVPPLPPKGRKLPGPPPVAAEQGGEGAGGRRGGGGGGASDGGVDSVPAAARQESDLADRCTPHPAQRASRPDHYAAARTRGDDGRSTSDVEIRGGGGSLHHHPTLHAPPPEQSLSTTHRMAPKQQEQPCPSSSTSIWSSEEGRGGEGGREPEGGKQQAVVLPGSPRLASPSAASSLVRWFDYSGSCGVLAFVLSDGSFGLRFEKGYTEMVLDPAGTVFDLYVGGLDGDEPLQSPAAAAGAAATTHSCGMPVDPFGSVLHHDGGAPSGGPPQDEYDVDEGWGWGAGDHAVCPEGRHDVWWKRRRNTSISSFSTSFSTNSSDSRGEDGTDGMLPTTPGSVSEHRKHLTADTSSGPGVGPGEVGDLESKNSMWEGGGGGGGVESNEEQSSRHPHFRYRLDFFPFYLRKKVKLVKLFRENILPREYGAGFGFGDAGSPPPYDDEGEVSGG